MFCSPVLGVISVGLFCFAFRSHLAVEVRAGCLLLLHTCCLVVVRVLCLFVTAPWVGPWA